MLKKLFLFLFVTGSLASYAQKTKPKTEPKPETVVSEPTPTRVDSFMGFALLDGMTPYDALEYQLPHEIEEDPVTHKKIFHKDIKKRNDSIRAAFRTGLYKKNMVFYAKTVKPKKAGERTSLCINIINKDTFLLYCAVDSTCRDPELVKELYRKVNGDTTYILILVDAFAKSGNCGSTNETKIVFARWHPKENKAIWRAKKISSCATTITNMTKEPIKDWDGKSKLEISFHKGDTFTDIFFDPDHPEKGIQTKGGGKE